MFYTFALKFGNTKVFKGMSCQNLVALAKHPVFPFGMSCWLKLSENSNCLEAKTQEGKLYPNLL